MTRSISTREALIESARTAFWARGYSNVSLRDVARGAGVDVALVSRHFGGKYGLFEATLEGAFVWPEVTETDPQTAITNIIAKLSNDCDDGGTLSPTMALVMNSTDPEVGELIRRVQAEQFLDPMVKSFGGESARPAVNRLMIAMVGATMARKTLALPGVSDASTTDYATQLRHLFETALQD